MRELYDRLAKEGYTLKSSADGKLQTLKSISSKKIVVFTQEDISDEALKEINYDMCTNLEVRVIRLNRDEFNEIKGL